MEAYGIQTFQVQKAYKAIFYAIINKITKYIIKTVNRPKDYEEKNLTKNTRVI